MNWLKVIFTNDAVVAGAKTLGKAILYAAMSALGVSWMSGCSIWGSGVGVTI